jgi:tetratricopeptide (TPR) repeat protein
MFRLVRLAYSTAGKDKSVTPIEAIVVLHEKEAINGLMSWDEFISNAQSSMEAGRMDEAAHYFKKALDIATRRYGRTDDKVLATLEMLADCLIAYKRGYKAKPHLEMLADILTAKYGMSSLELVEPLKKLFAIDLEEENFSSAEKVGRKLLHIQETNYGSNHLTVGDISQKLAELYEKASKYDAAEAHYKKALMAKAKILGNLHPDTIEILEKYSSLLRLMHRDDEARHLRDCIEAVALGLWEPGSQ